MTSFFVRKVSILTRSFFSLSVSCLLLALKLLHLLVQRLELGLGDRLALERGAGEVVAALRERLAGLGVELDHLLLQLVGLHLKPLLRRGHVGDALLDVLKQLDLLVVAVVERLGRVLGAVEGLRDLRFYDRGHATGQSCHVALLHARDSVPAPYTSAAWSPGLRQPRTRC